MGGIGGSKTIQVAQFLQTYVEEESKISPEDDEEEFEFESEDGFSSDEESEAEMFPEEEMFPEKKNPTEKAETLLTRWKDGKTPFLLIGGRNHWIVAANPGFPGVKEAFAAL